VKIELQIIKKIIGLHIPKGNTIITEGAMYYRWSDDPSSVYTHSMYNHQQGNFGQGIDSTSHVEQLWAHLKHIIKSIYYVIPTEYFVLFLREYEFRRNNIENKNIINDFEEIYEYIYDLYQTDFYEIDYHLKL
jgi:hypothetical protein